MNIDEVNDALTDARLSGDVELLADGKFKLTPRGHAHAEDTIAEKGLAMLLALSARHELDEGREPTVMEMANKLIAKFPYALQQKAKRNFAPFWGEYAELKPQEYLAAWQEAQDAAS